MMAIFAKRRRLAKWLGGLLATLFLLLLALYYLVQSPAFLRFAIHQLNKAIQGNISYSTFVLNLRQRNLEIRDLAYRNTSGEVIVALKSLDMKFQLPEAMRGDLAIKSLQVEGLTLDLSKAPPSRGPSTWRTALRLILRRVSMRDSTMQAVQIKLRNGDYFFFDAINLTLTSQQNSAQSFEAKVSRSTLAPGDLKIDTGPLELKTKIQIPLVQDFTFFVSEAEGSLNLQEIKIGELPPSSLVAPFKISGDTLSLQGGKFLHPAGNLNIDLDYIPKDSSAKLQLSTETPIAFSAIPKVSKELAETFGQFAFQLKTNLSGLKLKELSGKIDLAAQVFGNQVNPETPEQKLQLKGNFRQGVLGVQELNIQNAKTQLQAKGSVDLPQQKMDLQVSLKDFDLLSLIEALSDLELGGYVDATGNVRGSFRNPEMVFNTQGKQLSYAFLQFGNNNGVFKIANGDLSYEGTTPPGSDYEGKVSVLTQRIFQKTRQTSLKSQFSRLPVEALLENPDLTGRLTGTFDLDDTSDNPPTAKTEVKIEDFVAYDFHLGLTEAQGNMSQRQFIVNSLKYQPPQQEVLQAPGPIRFQFDERGVKLNGSVMNGVSVEGRYAYAGPPIFFIDVQAQDADLRPVLAALQLPTQEARADGDIQMKLGVRNQPSAIDIRLKRLIFPLEEGAVSNDGPIEVSIRPPKISFDRVQLQAEGQTLALKGNYIFNGPIDLSLTGNLNLELLSLFPQYFRNGDGFAKVDLKLKGTLKDPKPSGELTFQEAALTLRPLRGTVENLSGALRLTGNELVFDQFKGTMREGDIILNGKIDLDGLKPQKYDLEIETREVVIGDPGVYKMTFSGDFTLKGPQDKAILSGNLDINEGIYSRDFNITQFIIRPQEKSLKEEPSPFLKNIFLDLSIRSPGELSIRNNIADMYFNADLQVKGSAFAPKIDGALEVIGGDFHYLTVDFTGARGMIDFRDPEKGPYVDVSVQKQYESSIQSTSVIVHVQGFTDNLKVDFSSSPPLSRRDILALAFTGRLPGQSTTNVGGALATSVLAGQIPG